MQRPSQGLCLVEVVCLKTLGAPAVTLGKHLTRLLTVVLHLPKPTQAHGSPQLYGFGLTRLPAGACDWGAGRTSGFVCLILVE
jgi:hypothetical protein